MIKRVIFSIFLLISYQQFISCKFGDGDDLSDQNILFDPASDNFNAKFDLPNPGQVQVNIINSNGQLLQKVVENFHAKGSFTYPVNVSSLADGVYLCQLKADDISIVKRFVVRK
jgi:hypothetical protein